MDILQIDDTYIFDAINHSDVYWTISYATSGSTYYAVFNPCNVTQNLPTSQNTSEYTEFKLTPVPKNEPSSHCRLL